MKKINEKEIVEKLESLCKRGFSLGKNALRFGVLSALCVGAVVLHNSGYNAGVKDGEKRFKENYYPEIAEIINFDKSSVLVVDGKYRLDPNLDLSSDPNKIVFTSHRYRGNK